MKWTHVRKGPIEGDLVKDDNGIMIIKLTAPMRSDAFIEGVVGEIIKVSSSMMAEVK